ncbi:MULTISPECIES: 4'-phosphopantetheinyl transferase superfamily protein [unclassified Duganella]|uniref:4'-phosphopantetheinyl transferase family protein n=1 Tax=unclassified Duganella TaxID=2636909 RepID=UPI000E352C9A|nr:MULTISPECIES: 4'-phosphopantetheinyl transferase superfamily protein [unclassified Duganella]RFP14534.1 4-phosphopantetheinyl transferase [Duganella sp. BJB475]RFP30883.1 4-phosphopantetheinyl transferase [Duganella sp. BJB476]
MSVAASLWMTDADAVADGDLLDWLSASEMARYRRFVRAQRQRQFVAGRVLLRMALGSLLGVAPRDIELEDIPGGAPLLKVPKVRGRVPGFSISHSGRWVACAVSAQTALGLDIEMRDPQRDLAALAAQAFDADEMAQWARLQALDEAQRVAGFYGLWSGKEARFKLGGTAHAHRRDVPHEELSVVLYSALPLAAPPRMELVMLPSSPQPIP